MDIITYVSHLSHVQRAGGLLGANKASAENIKKFINNKDMLTQIAEWCGGGVTYESLTGGNYRLLTEPILYCVINDNKYAFTATEAALLKPHGDQKNWPLINNTLANAFYLEKDELGWMAWAGSSQANQAFDDIVNNLGLHIY